MKKILAVILTIVMLLGIAVFNTSADTPLTNTAMPTATLVTNEGSPLDVGTALDNGNFLTQDGRKFYFTLRFDNFIPIQGIDIRITVNEPSGIMPLSSDEGVSQQSEQSTDVITSVETFNLPSAVLGVDEFDENYVFEGGNHNAIHFVDINITSKSRIVIGLNSPSASTTVTAVGTYADTGETLFKIITTDKNYDIVEPRKIMNVANGQAEPDTGYFIPYGGVYTDVDKTFSTKDKNGNFTNIPEGSKFVQFKLPKEILDDNKIQINKLTPFGASTQMDSDENITTGPLAGSKGAWKFGSYSEYDDVTDSNPTTKMHHGTMMFVGDWLSLKEYYIKQGNTVQQFVKAIYEDITALENNPNNTDFGKNEADDFSKTFHVSYQIPNRRYSEATKETEPEYVWIDVYKLPRKHYIWRDNDGKLEYAIRFHNMQPSRTYTAVAYCLENEKSFQNAHISHNVKSIHLNENYGLGTNFEDEGYGNTNPKS